MITIIDRRNACKVLHDPKSSAEERLAAALILAQLPVKSVERGGGGVLVGAAGEER